MSPLLRKTAEPVPASTLAPPVGTNHKEAAPLAVPFGALTKDATAQVGGKCANLGELLRAGIEVPPGFAVTTEAFRRFVAEAGIQDRIRTVLSDCAESVDPTEYIEASKEIRALFDIVPIPPDLAEPLVEAYRRLAQPSEGTRHPVAVRSSATTEDLREASFAGQQETFLNVRDEHEFLEFLKKCWSSLYTPRAIYYREQNKVPHEAAYVAVGVQRMVDARTAGVAFTLDPVDGDRSRVVVEASWGLGEAIVGGRVRPDHFVLDRETLRILERDIASKQFEIRTRPGERLTVEQDVPSDRVDEPSLTDAEALEVAQTALRIEQHFGTPQDIEFAYEGERLWILQARPETVWSQRGPHTNGSTHETSAAPVLKGLPASPGIHIGRARIVLTPEEAAGKLRQGEILVTRMTNPDWVPYMKVAGAIVTSDGGTTCHAAIVSREMGVPCIVGARDATKILKDGEEYTIDAKVGIVYAGSVEELLPRTQPAATAPAVAPPVTSTKVYVNLSIPDIAQKVAHETQADGVGLLRAEHLMLSVGKHPRLLLEEESGAERMVEAFAQGIRKVATPFSPRPLVYRFLDFKPDEFLGLPGGQKYEHDAGHVGPNPLIGYRGCFRYLKEPDIFRLECRAIRRVREDYRLRNVHVMVPFVRTVDELRHALKIMDEEGLRRGPDFKVWMMVEVPSTVLLIDQFLDAGLDGISFGTNDLTMLILGVDRDDASVQDVYDERNPAVLRAMSHVIRICQERGVTTSVCGQAPSNYPEVVEFLLREGATSLSVNPDRVLETKLMVAGLERKMILEASRAQTRNGRGDEHLRPQWSDHGNGGVHR